MNTKLSDVTKGIGYSTTLDNSYDGSARSPSSVSNSILTKTMEFLLGALVVVTLCATFLLSLWEWQAIPAAKKDKKKKEKEETKALLKKAVYKIKNKLNPKYTPSESDEKDDLSISIRSGDGRVIDLLESKYSEPANNELNNPAPAAGPVDPNAVTDRSQCICVVNEWALQHNYNTKNFRYRRDLTPGQARIYIEGEFRFGGEREQIKGLYDIWNGICKTHFHTECGTLQWVKADDNVGVGTRPLLFNMVPDATMYDRVLRCALAVTPHLDLKRQPDMIAIASRIKNQYRKYYGEYAELDSMIGQVLQDNTFIQEHAARQYTQFITYERRLTLRINGYLMTVGDKNVDDLIARRYYWKLVYTVIGFLLVAPQIHSLLIHHVLDILGLILRFSVNDDGVYYSDPRITNIVMSTMVLWSSYWVRSLLWNNRIDELHHFAGKYVPGIEPGIQPCANVTLAASTIAPDRLETVVRDDAQLVSNYVKEDPGDVKDKEYQVFGATMPVPYVISQGTAQDMEGALRLRMLSTNPKSVDPKFSKQFFKFCLRVFEKMPTFDVTCTAEEAAAYFSSKYNVARSKELLELREYPILDEQPTYKMFVKKEVYMGKDCENYKPRMIWSCPDAILARFGPEFHKLSKAVAKHWDGSGDIYYVSGSTPDSVGAFGERMELDCVEIKESDVSNWDGSQEKVSLDAELRFLRTNVVGMPEDWKVLEKYWTSSKGVNSDHSVQVKMQHGRRSGDPVTSVFNTLLNVLYVMFLYKVNFGEFMMLVLGDDNVVGLRKACKVSTDDIIVSYKKLGMKCEVIDRCAIAETTFCSGRFWKVDGGYRWGNQPMRGLAKFGINYHQHSPKKFKGLLYGTALSMLPTAGHVPVIGAFLRAIIASSKAKKIKALYDNRHENPFRIQGGTVLTPSADTYVQFSMLYDTAIDTILELEEWMAKNIDVESCPYRLDDSIFIEGFKKENEAECESAKLSFIPKDDKDIKKTVRFNVGGEITILSEDYVLNVAPVVEEREKLKGVTDVVGAMVSGWEFGKDEDKLYGLKVHCFLHAIFSALSYINFSWGVGLHAAYNRFAVRTLKKNCNKSIYPATKKGKQKQPPKKTKEKSKAKKTRKKGFGDVMRVGGEVLGNLVGGTPGGYFGKMAGNWIAKISGMGDYKVKANSLFNGQVPAFRPNNHSLRVTHREFLGDITGSIAFDISNYTINPSAEETFPWMSQLSNLYTQYKLNGMIFEFKSTSANALNSTNTALGTVIMATRYNVYDSAFTTKIEAENYEYSTSSKPSECCIHPIECKPSEGPFQIHFIRHGIDEEEEDQRLYDWGTFSLITVGMQAAAVIGELWVSYDITLEKPRMNPAGFDDSRHFRSAGAINSTTITLGATSAYGSNCDITTDGLKTITFPDSIATGRFLVILFFRASNDTYTRTYTRAALATDGWGLSLSTLWTATVTSTASISLDIIDVSGPAPTLVITATVADPTDTVDVMIFQVPSGGEFPASVIAAMLPLYTTDEKENDEDDKDYLAFLAWKAKRSLYS